MRIAIDFDQTIFNRRTGEMDGKDKINNWHDEGYEITIFTSRPDTEFSTIEAQLNKEGICFDRIICGKPMYDLLIDDKASRFEGWQKDYDEEL